MTAFSDTPDPNVIRFLPGRSRADDQYLGDLMKGLATSVKEVEARNLALEEQNVELLSALKEANKRITRINNRLRRTPNSLGSPLPLPRK